VFTVHTQAVSSCEVQEDMRDHDDGNSSSEESRFIADTDTNVDTTSSDTDCHSVTPVDKSLPAAVDGEVRQFSDASRACDDNITSPTELDTATLSDTGSRRVTDQSRADTDTTDITIQHVSDSDVCVVASTFDSEINLGQKVEVESSNTEHNHGMACDTEAKKIAVDLSQEESTTSDPTLSAESAGGKEPNQNDDKDQPSRPNTILRWSDQSSDVTTTSKTKCAIQFENSVIFDLDVE